MSSAVPLADTTQSEESQLSDISSFAAWELAHPGQLGEEEIEDRNDRDSEAETGSGLGSESEIEMRGSSGLERMMSRMFGEGSMGGSQVEDGGLGLDGAGASKSQSQEAEGLEVKEGNGEVEVVEETQLDKLVAPAVATTPVKDRKRKRDKEGGRQSVNSVVDSQFESRDLGSDYDAPPSSQPRPRSVDERQLEERVEDMRDDSDNEHGNKDVVMNKRKDSIVSIDRDGLTDAEYKKKRKAAKKERMKALRTAQKALGLPANSFNSKPKPKMKVSKAADTPVQDTNDPTSAIPTDQPPKPKNAKRDYKEKKDNKPDTRPKPKPVPHDAYAPSQELTARQVQEVERNLPESVKRAMREAQKAVKDAEVLAPASSLGKVILSSSRSIVMSEGMNGAREGKEGKKKRKRERNQNRLAEEPKGGDAKDGAAEKAGRKNQIKDVAIPPPALATKETEDLGEVETSEPKAKERRRDRGGKSLSDDPNAMEVEIEENAPPPAEIHAQAVEEPLAKAFSSEKLDLGQEVAIIEEVEAGEPKQKKRRRDRGRKSLSVAPDAMEVDVEKVAIAPVEQPAQKTSKKMESRTIVIESQATLSTNSTSQVDASQNTKKSKDKTSKKSRRASIDEEVKSQVEAVNGKVSSAPLYELTSSGKSKRNRVRKQSKTDPIESTAELDGESKAIHSVADDEVKFKDEFEGFESTVDLNHDIGMLSEVLDEAIRNGIIGDTYDENETTNHSGNLTNLAHVDDVIPFVSHPTSSHVPTTRSQAAQQPLRPITPRTRPRARYEMTASRSTSRSDSESPIATHATYDPHYWDNEFQGNEPLHQRSSQELVTSVETPASRPIPSRSPALNTASLARDKNGRFAPKTSTAEAGGGSARRAKRARTDSVPGPASAPATEVKLRKRRSRPQVAGSSANTPTNVLRSINASSQRRDSSGRFGKSTVEAPATAGPAFAPSPEITLRRRASLGHLAGSQADTSKNLLKSINASSQKRDSSGRFGKSTCIFPNQAHSIKAIPQEKGARVESWKSSTRIPENLPSSNATRQERDASGRFGRTSTDASQPIQSMEDIPSEFNTRRRSGQRTSDATINLKSINAVSQERDAKGRFGRSSTGTSETRPRGRSETSRHDEPKSIRSMNAVSQERDARGRFGRSSTRPSENAQSSKAVSQERNASHGPGSPPTDASRRRSLNAISQERDASGRFGKSTVDKSKELSSTKASSHEQNMSEKTSESQADALRSVQSIKAISQKRDAHGRFGKSSFDTPKAKEKPQVRSKSQERDTTGRFAGSPSDATYQEKPNHKKSILQGELKFLLRQANERAASSSAKQADVTSPRPPHSQAPLGRDSRGRFAPKRDDSMSPFQEDPPTSAGAKATTLRAKAIVPRDISPSLERGEMTETRILPPPSLMRDIHGKFAPKQAKSMSPPQPNLPTQDDERTHISDSQPDVLEDIVPIPPPKRAKRQPIKSPFFPAAPSLAKSTQKKGTGQSPAKGEPSSFQISPSKRRLPISCIPFPPLSAPRFGLIQEKLADDPFRLLIAVTFLIRTHGKHAIPIFFELMEKFPTPEALVAADKHDIIEIIRHLGLQNQRAETYKEYARIWLEDPPMKGKRYPVRGYPDPLSARDTKRDDILTDEDERHAWEIGHMTSGPYALDSWRIFCRDKLRGMASDWNGRGTGDREMFQPEWMRVLPEDKELRAYLRWMWLKEGFEWDPFTGDREVASQKLLRAANAGKIAWDDEGGMRIINDDDGEQSWSNLA